MKKKPWLGWEYIILCQPHQSLKVGLEGGFYIQNGYDFPVRIFITRNIGSGGEVHCEKCQALVDLRK